MRALVLDRPREPLRLVERPAPDPGPGQVRLRVRACGVCRTDLHVVDGELPPLGRPVVPGHQVVGTVEAAGPGASRLAPGQRVGVPWLGWTCGSCRFCSSGRENLCEQATFTGWDRDGGFAERMTVRADMAHRLPDGFDDLAAAPLLCGGVIGYRSLRVSGIRPGERLGLFGFGASALLAIQVARHWDCEVFVWTRSERERVRARELGAAWVGGYDETAPAPLQAAVTFAPSGDVAVAALRALDRGGTLAINAIHLDRVPEFPYEHLWWERSIRSVANFTRQDAREFLALAAAIPVRTATEVHPLEDGSAALRRLEDGLVEGAAVLRMPE
jgi:propanol-preferring alcohol dehydrogenase